MEMKQEFDLGDKVEDLVTGAKGIITGIGFYLTGCIRYVIYTKITAKEKETKSYYVSEGKMITKRK